ncbi:hypothetical protein BDR07DRAFT_1402437 [Suillus spraguei]|nr:hypothetical protein BDR07DRAFT_1402437 [Suillus spraguei]
MIRIANLIANQTSIHRTPEPASRIPTIPSSSLTARASAPSSLNASSSWMQCCARFSGLETAMDTIKILHQQLVERKEKIIQSMSFHKGLKSVWRLPTGVLSQIFHQCLPEDKYSSSAPKLAPMLLTRICRPWTDVAADMPS